MSRQNKETHGVQVFPFLAVLVCTMGALIFLLLVTTSQIRNRPVDSLSIPETHQNFAESESAPLSPPTRGFPEPKEKSDSQTIVIPPQPPRESKPVKVPDQSYALALAQREREISELTTKWKVRTNILAKERKRYQAALKEHKALYDAAVERADSLKSEVSKIEGQLEQLDHEVAATATDSKEQAELQQIEQKIVEMKKRLRAAQAEEATAENDKFQVVPFDVQTGTTRRPIFLECTATGIRIQPENIQITAADLVGFTNQINPLAAGTGALINYWTDQNRKQRGLKPASEPYVLLLVRPDGVRAYYVALGLLAPIRTSHGYELVDDSIKLQFPEVDQAAKAACQRAIDHILSERETITRTAIAYGGAGSVIGGPPRSGVPGGKGGGSGNGFYSGSGAGPGSPDGRSKSSGNGFSMNDVAGDTSPVGNHSWERIENFEGRPPKRRSSDTGNGSNSVATGPTAKGTSTSGGAAAGGSSPSGSSSGASRGASSSNGGSLAGVTGGSPPPGGSPSSGSTSARAVSSKSMFGDDDDNSELIAPRSGMNQQDGTPVAVGPTSQNGQSSQNGSPSVFGMNGSVPDASSGISGTSAAQFGNPSSQRGSGTALQGATSGQGNGQTSTSQAGAGQTAMNGGNGSSGNRRAGSSDADATGFASGNYSNDSMWAAGGQDPNMPIGERPGKKRKNNPPPEVSEGSAESGDDTGADGSPGGGPGSGSGSGRSSRGRRPLLSDSGPAVPRDPNGKRPSASSVQSQGKPNDDSNERQLEPEMLAGRRWGFCEPGASIGLEREVRIDVTSDKMVIAEQFEIPTGSETSKQETFERLATGIDKFSREWGRPPQGFFWTPRLKFIVKPEAYGQYEQMNSLMIRAGLPTSHEFARNAETIEYGRETIGTTKGAPKSASKTTTGGYR